MKRVAILSVAVLLAACSQMIDDIDDDAEAASPTTPSEVALSPSSGRGTGEGAFISRVLEFCPAPGQFVNTLPEWEAGNTEADMCRKCEEYIAGQMSGGLISLGGFGGYITFAFDHPVRNDDGSDFRILGNSYLSAADPTGRTDGGSFEPGIVMVSVDVNGNGLPDDEWYELQGSAHDLATRDYAITYTDEFTYVTWRDNQGQSGVIEKNAYHRQPYYPQWKDEEMTLTGTLLPPVGIDRSGNGTYWVLYQAGRLQEPDRSSWGYVDNSLNTAAESTFDISWAVNSQGEHVVLSQVDFIRVYCACHQICGWLGEVSTEICGAVDLHVAGEYVKIDTGLGTGIVPVFAH